MKNLWFIIFMLFSAITFSQKDSLVVGDKYLEDQIYLSVSYNVLSNQPNEVNDSGFSYGISTGFIKDLPFNKSRTFGLGLGLGYGYDSFNHGLKVEESNNVYSFQTDNSLESNKLRIHNIEIPLEIRWRNSNKTRYAFWRVYTGLKVTYNFANKFEYVSNGNTTTFNNIEPFNTWQTGLTVSAGYDAFNFYFYYGLTPLLKNATLNNTSIDTRILKFGISFYIL